MLVAKSEEASDALIAHAASDPHAMMHLSLAMGHVPVVKHSAGSAPG